MPAGTNCAALPIGMFHTLSAAKGHVNLSRHAGCANRADGAAGCAECALANASATAVNLILKSVVDCPLESAVKTSVDLRTRNEFQVSVCGCNLERSAGDRDLRSRPALAIMLDLKMQCMHVWMK